MEPRRLFLRPHVFLSLEDRYAVILDARRDRYLCVLRRHFDALAPWLSGWPAGRGTSPPLRPPPQEGVAELAAQFVSRGILTDDPAGARPVCPVSVPVPKARASGGERPRPCAVLAKAAGFFQACRRADHALRHASFDTVLHAVAARRRAGAGRVASICMERAAALAEVFDTLRPLYPRPYLCTFDSLALLEFLAPHGLYPHWIFGVRAEPFQAHCWLQCGETLLNDRVERVSRLGPIMVV